MRYLRLIVLLLIANICSSCSTAALFVVRNHSNSPIVLITESSGRDVFRHVNKILPNGSSEKFPLNRTGMIIVVNDMGKVTAFDVLYGLRYYALSKDNRHDYSPLQLRYEPDGRLFFLGRDGLPLLSLPSFGESNVPTYIREELERVLFPSTSWFWLVRQIENYVSERHQLPPSLAYLGMPQESCNYYSKTHTLVSTNINEFLSGKADFVYSRELNDAQNRIANKLLRVDIERIMERERVIARVVRGIAAHMVNNDSFVFPGDLHELVTAGRTNLFGEVVDKFDIGIFNSYWFPHSQSLTNSVLWKTAWFSPTTTNKSLCLDSILVETLYKATGSEWLREKWDERLKNYYHTDIPKSGQPDK